MSREVSEDEAADYDREKREALMRLRNRLVWDRAAHGVQECGPRCGYCLEPEDAPDPEPEDG